MSFRFRQTIRIFPGLRLNLSKSGLSLSAGVPGATMNFGRRGTSLTLGIPGTGMSYRHQFESNDPAGSSNEAPSENNSDSFLGNSIQSAELATLHSADLDGLKQLFVEASEQKEEAERLLQSALDERARKWRKLRRWQQPPLNWISKRAEKLQIQFDDAERAAIEAARIFELSIIPLDLQLATGVEAAWRGLRTAFLELSKCSMIWDVTSTKSEKEYRSSVATSITRKPVSLRLINDDILGHLEGLRFENANGGDLDIFPVFCCVRGSRMEDFALLDIREISLTVRTVKFVETESVPPDSPLGGFTWAKVNNDGSPDRRFKGNHQIPLTLYGELEFRSKTGVWEAYQFSNPEKAIDFAAAFVQFFDAVTNQVIEPEMPPIQFDGPAAKEIRLPELPQVRSNWEFWLIGIFFLALCFVYVFS